MNKMNKRSKSIKKIQIKIPMRYLPKSLSRQDKEKQKNMLLKSRKLYKKNNYFNRSRVSSYKNKTSSHILDARRIYNIDKITPSKELSMATGCSMKGLEEIVKKGEGAYYSSGSRPNQTSQSWGLARLASSVTGGKASAVDYSILERECNHSQKAFMLAKKSLKKYKFGHAKTRKIVI